MDETSNEKILGKFDSVEALAESYKQLESKLGKRSEPKAESGPDVSGQLRAIQEELAAFKKEREAERAAANHPLKNADFKKQLAAGLSQLPQEKVAEIQKRIDAGKVDESELRIYASLADKPKDSAKAVGVDGEVKGDYDSIMTEYMQLVEKSTEWMDMNHPNFSKASERKEALERKLGIR